MFFKNIQRLSGPRFKRLTGVTQEVFSVMLEVVELSKA
jgi:hypothetical protein